MDFMEFFQAFLFVLGLLLKIFSGYFLIVALFAFRRARPCKRAAPRTRFAVLIPARNEEAVIAGLIGSLNAQDYPSELFDVFVIPNNCTDGTESAALSAGAEIIRCEKTVRYKGDALHEAFEKLMSSPRGYDAFCVFDADNVASPQFLAAMNDAIVAGARVCKGRIMAKNPYDSATAGCYAIYFELFNLFFNRARSLCGLSAKVVGTGFAVHREVIEKLGGWNTETIAEDAEFAAQLTLAGERVTWVPDAITYDEEPNSPVVSVTQRKRWCCGILDVARLKLPGIFAGSAKKAPVALTLDLVMILLSPIAQAAGIIPTAATIITSVRGGAAALSALGVELLAAYTALALLGVLMSALAGYDVRRIFKSALAFPLFMASWVPIQVFALFAKSSSWREMRHTVREVAPSSLAKPRI
jgi:cellulose synthase/poly-beta-1,6-N-acetylglucosamine synthase-like glycosyltransferase